jgi:hypothetical protein
VRIKVQVHMQAAAEGEVELLLLCCTEKPAG